MEYNSTTQNVLFGNPAFRALMSWRKYDVIRKKYGECSIESNLCIDHNR